MNGSKQYQLKDRELVLSAKKAPFAIRFILYLFSFMSLLLPLSGTIIGLAMGTGLSFGNIIIIIVFGLVGFYLLRISLWNTHGKELITFHADRIEYIGDYGWFKDGKKQIQLDRPVEFGIRQIGYEEDNKGALIIGLEAHGINCVTKMSKSELEELIDQLKNLNAL